MIVFKLSMPNNNSWNSRWSGDGDVHIITTLVMVGVPV